MGLSAQSYELAAQVVMGAAALLLLASALWPPFNWRRAATAVCIALVAGVTLTVDELQSIRKPARILIIAECEVLDDPAFAAEITKIVTQPMALLDLALHITPQATGETCTRPPPPGIRFDALDTPLPGAQALTRAREWFDDTAQGYPFWTRAFWARFLRNTVDLGHTNRLVLAHAPLGPLDPGNAGSGPARTRLDLADGGMAEVTHASFGSEPLTEMALSVVPSAIAAYTPYASWHIRLFAEMRDTRLATAKEAAVTYGTRIIDCDGTPKIKASETTLDSLPLNAGGPPGPIDSLTDPSAHLSLSGSVPTLHVGITAELTPSDCPDFQTWSEIVVTLMATLDDGTSITESRAVMLRAVRQGGVTLVTPSASDSVLQRMIAAPGWEQDTTIPSGYGLNVIADPNAVVRTIIKTVADPNCRADIDTCLAPPRAMLRETAECWFQGADAARTQPDRFRECLARTRRLLLVAPDAAAFGILDGAAGATDLTTRIESGALDAMIAAPAYDATDAAALPPWATIPTSEPFLRAEPRVAVSVSRRQALRMRIGGTSALARQRGFLDALAGLGVVGPSGPVKAVSGLSGHAACLPTPTTGWKGGLAWFSGFANTATHSPHAAPASPAGDGILDERLRGILSLLELSPPLGAAEPPRNTPGLFARDAVCTSPVLRLHATITGMIGRGEWSPDGETANRAVIGLFAEDDLHVTLKGVAAFEAANGQCLSTASNANAVRNTIKDYVDKGGRIVVIPVKDPSDYSADRLILRSATGGEEPVDIAGMIADLRTGTLFGAQRIQALAGSTVLGTGNLEDVARTFARQIKTGWQGADTVQRLRSVTLGDGFLTDRRDTCFPRIEQNGSLYMLKRGGCAFAPGNEFAPATYRLDAAPERVRRLRPVDDPMIWGRQHLCSGEEIAAARLQGMGQVTVTGYSPFARDMVAEDISYPAAGTFGVGENGAGMLLGIGPDAALRSLGKCYQYAGGRVAEPLLQRYRWSAKRSVPYVQMRTQGHGGLTAIQRFIGHSQISPADGRPRVTAIHVDPQTGAIDIEASADLSGSWTWDDAASLMNDPAASLRATYVDLDRATGVARITVAPDRPLGDGILMLPLFRDGSGTVSPRPVLVPVDFAGPPLAEATLQRKTSFSTLPVYRFSSGDLAILGLLFATLAMFSPPIRRWHRIGAMLRGALGSRGPDGFAQTAQRAPLFSVEAGLAEWGMHPGTPAAIRSFGLPAGFRSWRSGDQGGAIRPSTLFTLISRQEGLPRKIPTVRLRTSAQAASVLILIEGNGALRTPLPRRSAAKTVFAARLATFLAKAVTLSHGVAEIRRIGLEALPSSDASDMEAAIFDSLSHGSDALPPADAMENDTLDGRIVYYICDGLSVNKTHLLEMADVLSADGAELRVAAIVSDDDRDALGLRRDPLDGRFDDDTETHPLIILSRRDASIDDTAIVLARRQGMLVTLDTALDTSGVIERLADTGFLK